MLDTKQTDEIQCESQHDQLALCAGRMYWLALVLTDDQGLAGRLTHQEVEHLFIGKGVFDVWMARWARRLTIKACIAAKQIDLAADGCNAAFWEAAWHRELESLTVSRGLSLDSIRHAVKSLPLLPRFVFVMHALEKYPLADVALLLKVSKSASEAALTYSLTALAHAVHSPELSSWMEAHSFAGSCAAVSPARQ